MKYKSGDVQKILGISTETLRFFEAKGLIEPQRNEANKYRYYDSLDLNKIVAYKLYRGLEYSLEESLEMVKIGNEEQIKRHEKQKDLIREKLNYYENLYARISEIHQNYIDILDLHINYRIEDSPEVILYCNQTNEEFEINQKVLATNVKWLEQLPFVQLAIHISVSNQQLGRDVLYGYAVKTMYSHAVEELKDCCYKLYHSKRCIHAMLKVSDQKPFSVAHCQKIIDYINHYQMKIAGDIFGWIVNEEVLETEKIRYFEVWIPIEN